MNSQQIFKSDAKIGWDTFCGGVLDMMFAPWQLVKGALCIITGLFIIVVAALFIPLDKKRDKGAQKQRRLCENRNLSTNYY